MKKQWILAALAIVVGCSEADSPSVPTAAEEADVLTGSDTTAPGEIEDGSTRLQDVAGLVM